MNQLAQDLRAAKALIDTPEKWAQGSNALDSKGDPVACWDDRAQMFCMIGAVSRSLGELPMDRPASVIDALRGCGPFVQSLSKWNDAPERTHAEVMDLFDRAIEKAEAGNA